jgi:hypothetical protein
MLTKDFGNFRILCQAEIATLSENSLLSRNPRQARMPVLLWGNVTGEEGVAVVRTLIRHLGVDEKER